MSQKEESGCLSLLIGMGVAFIIFTIFPPSFLLSIPILGAMLYKGLFKSTAKIVAKGVDEQIEKAKK